MEQVRCPVCQDLFNEYQLIKPYRCNIHGICEECLDKWSGTCPLCRSLPTRTVEYYDDGENIRVERWKNADGKLHREFLPALIQYFRTGEIATQLWCRNGKRDNDNAPAAMSFYQTGSIRLECWYKQGRKFREYGPTTTEFNSDGSVYTKWWYEDGKLYHSMEYYPSGELQTENWFKDRKLHRGGDYPAQIEYLLNGEVQSNIWYDEGDKLREVIYYENGSTAEKMSKTGLSRWGRNGVNEKGKLRKGYYYAKGGWLMRKSRRLNRMIN
jgi:hypothetical protein